MPLDKATFAQDMDTMWGNCLAHIASVREPGDTAEALLGTARTWLEGQSDAERTVKVLSSGLLFRGEQTANDMMQVVVEAEWSDGSGLAQATFQVHRHDLEG